MRKALVIGIDYYDDISKLYGCVNDAYAVKSMLERNSDGTINFAVKAMMSNAEPSRITRSDMREAVQALFSGVADVALFYFAGHGFIDNTGGFLIASDSRSGDDGLSLAELVTFANQSSSRNKVIILDSCHSGIAGSRPGTPATSEIREGTTILTASTAEQYASEEDGSGIFTSLLVDALGGAAANLVGDISPGGIYAHIDQSLGPWQQRPVFKTNVQNFVCLRRAAPPIELSDLRRLPDFFPEKGFEFILDPSYEPQSSFPDPIKTAEFSILQKYARLNLLIPLGEEHMYFAAMNSKACKLTALGEHYRILAARNLI